MSTMKQFLLAFDHEIDQLVVERDFDTDVQAAIAEYRNLEEQYKNSPRMDIVLVGSDSLESIRITHSNYFEGVGKSSIENVLDRMLSS